MVNERKLVSPIEYTRDENGELIELEEWNKLHPLTEEEKKKSRLGLLKKLLPEKYEREMKMQQETEQHHWRRTFRRTAREAVIFMLAAMALSAVAVLIYSYRDQAQHIQVERSALKTTCDAIAQEQALTDRQAADLARQGVV